MPPTARRRSSTYGPSSRGRSSESLSLTRVPGGVRGRSSAGSYRIGRGGATGTQTLGAARPIGQSAAVDSGAGKPRASAAMLRDIGLFGGLDDETLDVLARELPTVTFTPGSDVVREGDQASEMFVVVAGELEVLKHGRVGD